MSLAAIRDLERRLQSQLRRSRLVFELGLDPELEGEIVQSVATLVRVGPGDIHELGERYPALLVSYLTAEGIHSYEAGAFWPKLRIPELRNSGPSLGAQFEDALRRLGLPTFEELVTEDGATRWVSRILIHGGIPRYSLNDFFRLLMRSLRGAPVQAADLVGMWRARRTRFQGIDRPVERFLLRGGDVALDLLDRCIEMALEERRTGAVPSPQQLGLPRYVVDAYASLPQQELGISGQSSRIPRPRVELDPWDPFGPRMVLPAVPQDPEAAEWRLNDGTSVTAVLARSDRDEHALLKPALHWTVTLWRGNERLQELTFEALDELPLLLFNPDSGRLVANRQVLRLQSVWALHPSEVRLTSDAEGRLPLGVRERFPEPVGHWLGYVRMHYELEGTSEIYVQRQKDAPWSIRVARPGQRPRLVGQTLDGITTDQGHVVYAAPPSLDVPSIPDMAPAHWMLTLRWHGGSLQRSLAEVPRGDEGLYDLGAVLDQSVPNGVVKLILRGPLGSDLREEFALIRGLSLRRPTTLLLASDGPVKVELSLSSPDTSRQQWQEVSIPSDKDEAMIPIPTWDDPQFRVRVTVPRVLWRLDRTDDPRSSFGNDVVTTSVDEILDGVASALSVRTRLPGTQLMLVLADGSQILQTSGWVRTSGVDGRWTFKLYPFIDTLRSSASPILSLELVVNERRQLVGQIVARLLVSDFDSLWEPKDSDEATFLLAFSEERPLRGRVARLWALDRPWESPVVAAIPDGQTTALFEGIPFGRYLAEIAIGDDWVRPSRPAIGSPNTQLVTIGSDGDRATRAARLDLASPYAVLEAAVTSDRALRPLTKQEMTKVGPGALSLLTLMLEEHGDRALTMKAFTRVVDVLLQMPAEVLTSLTAADSLPNHVLMASILLLPGIKQRRPGIDEGVMRELWSVSPALAAVIDIPRGSHDDSAAARVEEYLGWSCQEGKEPFVGGSVELPFAQMERERVVEISVAMSLVPKRWLDPDSLVVAYLDWIEARYDSLPEIDTWWRKASGLLSTAELAPLLSRAVMARRPLPQAPDWFIFPQVTLGAAAHLICGTGRAEQATVALVEAIAFGSRLVIRDLLLACVLDHLSARETKPWNP